MKKKSNFASTSIICFGCIILGMGLGIMIAKKAQGGCV